MAELEATLDTEEEAGWLEHFRMEAEEHEARMKEMKREAQSKRGSR